MRETRVEAHGKDTPEAGEAPGESLVSRGGVRLLTAASVILGVLLLYSLWAFWPGQPQQAGTSPPPPQSVNYFGLSFTLARETQLFLVVAIAGALGGLIHSIRSISWYVGNRSFRWSWVPFTMSLPVIGALGGTVFYLVLRAGLFSPSTSAEQASPFGFAAIAVLVGLFSEQALEKLQQVASNLFAERPKGKDHVEIEEEERSGDGQVASTERASTVR
jgi:membrane protein implicated in regulation of membrane protease activity